MKILFVLFILINTILLAKSKELIFVELQSRHGARAPLELNDKNQDVAGENWTNVGELSGVGQRMEYVLGLRNRYKYITNEHHFLSTKYDPHELLVFSTSLNRTLLSMTSQLQGLYPMSEEYCDNLNEYQLDNSKPAVDTDCEEIEDELTRIGNSSLPNYMTIIPIHMIHSSEKKIVNYDNSKCKPNVEKVTNKNIEEKQTIIDCVNSFKTKYSENLTRILPKNFEYNFDSIDKLCDVIIVDKTEQKTLDYFFEKTNFDRTPFINDCLEVLKLHFRDRLFGDDKKEIILFEVSAVLREMVHYIKQRVDADIKREKIEENIADFSRPKMVIISGHDTTLAAQILFIIKFFNLKYEFELPDYSAQTAFEVSREKKNDMKLEYSDYNVHYYFNDKCILDVKLDKFIETIENNIWTQEQINRYCEYGDIGSDSDSDEESQRNLIILIGLISAAAIALILFIVIICLCVKICKKKQKDRASMDSDKLLNE